MARSHRRSGAFLVSVYVDAERSSGWFAQILKYSDARAEPIQAKRVATGSEIYRELQDWLALTLPASN